MAQDIPYLLRGITQLTTESSALISSSKYLNNPALREWLSQCRLDMWGKLMPVPLGQSPQDDALRASRRAAAEAMCRKLDELLGSES